MLGDRSRGRSAVEALYGTQRFRVAVGCHDAAHTSFFFQGRIIGGVRQRLRIGK
jgi:hypothetical protein